jgi:hypothetical protein
MLERAGTSGIDQAAHSAAPGEETCRVGRRLGYRERFGAPPNAPPSKSRAGGAMRSCGRVFAQDARKSSPRKVVHPSRRVVRPSREGGPSLSRRWCPALTKVLRPSDGTPPCSKASGARLGAGSSLVGRRCCSARMPSVAYRMHRKFALCRAVLSRCCIVEGRVRFSWTGLGAVAPPIEWRSLAHPRLDHL